MGNKNTSALHRHLIEVKEGKRCFENAFQGVARMILESEIQKVVVNGKPKHVAWFTMEPFEGRFAPNDEVDEVAPHARGRSSS